VPQSVPQAPQFWLFVVMSTHVPEQAVPPPMHVHTPALQLWPSAQTLPQLPQLATSVCKFAQAPPQLVKPVWQLQTPPTQLLPAGQTLLHEPQLALFVIRSTQIAPQLVAPAAQPGAPPLPEPVLPGGMPPEISPLPQLASSTRDKASARNLERTNNVM
jgi:hypothetical protein